MAGAKEIRSKIASVQNTQKITKAMEMVAASKMRKSQERMAASRPYADTMRKVIGHLANGNLEYKHPYLEERDVKRVGYLVVSTDRGLCGGFDRRFFVCGVFAFLRGRYIGGFLIFVFCPSAGKDRKAQNQSQRQRQHE